MALIATTAILPRIIGILLLAGDSAFIITTENSYLLSGCTNISQDLYRGFFNKETTDRQVFWETRITVVVLGVVAWLFGQYFPTILEMQMHAYTMYGATITPILFSIFLMRKRLTKWAGILGMLTGGATTLIWDIPLGAPYGITPVIPAVPLAAIVIVVGSFIEGSLKGE